MVRRFGRQAAACALSASLLLFLLPATSFAQDDDDGLSFGEDEAQGGGDEAGGDDGLSFGEDEGTGGDTLTDTGDPMNLGNNNSGSLAIVGVKTDAIDDAQRQKLQEELNEAMKLVNGFDTQAEGGVLANLNDQGEECVREPLCLANVGQEASVDKLLLGRITKIGETYKLDIDFFDVKERLFISYESVENLGSPNAALDNVEPAVRRLFKVRENSDGPIVEDKPKNEWIQPTFAYTSAGLAAACIVGGAVFGSQAKKDYDALVTDSEAGNLSQRAAREQYNTVNAKARRANLFYGLGVGLGVLSAVLFTVDLGSDVAEDDDTYVRGPKKTLHFAPTVSVDGGGIGTLVRF